MSDTLQVLTVDDDRKLRGFLVSCLEKEGYRVTDAASGREALACLDDQEFDVVLLDLVMPPPGGLEVLREIRDRGLRSEVLMLTGNSEIETAVEAIKLGAYDYMTKPVDLPKFLRLVAQAGAKARLESENTKLRRVVERHQGTTGPVISKSAEMREVLKTVEAIAPSDAAVLITGETGTGKSLIAKLIHGQSLRADRPLVPVNCGALHEQLFESELFGHVKGSFTGASGTKAGLFEVADGGTLFLDEVAEMSPHLQAKLLQVLDSGELRRVGATVLRKVDVRVLAATNKVLEDEVRAGTFRQDLFFRLNTLHIRLAPLRNRTADIADLVELYLTRFRRPGREVRRLAPAALDQLMAYHWPGNVRELANTIETVNLLCPSDVIGVEHLPSNVRAATGPANEAQTELMSIAAMERLQIDRALRETNGNKTAAARLLGIHVKTLQNKLKKYESG